MGKTERRDAVLMLLRKEESGRVLARRYGVSEATLYRWRDEFIEGGTAALAGKQAGDDGLRQENRELRREIEKREPITDYRARILIGGSIIDQPELIKIIEDAGGVVVADVLCTGTRWTMDKVEMNGDPLYAIAKRYYDHQPCPRLTFVYERKRDFVLDVAKQFKVDGAIFSKISFCDHHSGDNVLYKEDLEEVGVPSLLLDRDYRITDVGRFKTRIEAFFEKLGK